FRLSRRKASGACHARDVPRQEQLTMSSSSSTDGCGRTSTTNQGRDLRVASTAARFAWTPSMDYARSMEFPIIRRSRRAGRLLFTDDQSKLIQDERDFHDDGICQFFRVGSLIGLIWAWAQEE